MGVSVAGGYKTMAGLVARTVPAPDVGGSGQKIQWKFDAAPDESGNYASNHGGMTLTGIGTPSFGAAPDYNSVNYYERQYHDTDVNAPSFTKGQDCLVGSTGTDYQFLAGNFTVEFWFYYSNTLAGGSVLSIGGSKLRFYATQNYTYNAGGGPISTYFNGQLNSTPILSGNGILMNANQWHHVAFVRSYSGSSSAQVNMFIDGTPWYKTIATVPLNTFDNKLVTINGFSGDPTQSNDSYIHALNFWDYSRYVNSFNILGPYWPGYDGGDDPYVVP